MFSIICKGFLLNQINLTLLEGESSKLIKPKLQISKAFVKGGPS